MAGEELFWAGFKGSGKGSLGAGKGQINPGDKLPDGYSDPRLEGWKKEGTVSISQPDTSEQFKDEIELLKIELSELKEKNESLKSISRQFAESESTNEKLIEKNKKVEGAYSNLQSKVSKVAEEVIKKLQDDSMSRKEKDEAAKLLKGLING